jgi:hypothetical protein
MPSHPDRVRRSYHGIYIKDYKDMARDEDCITIRISKEEIATAMSAKEIYHNVVRAIRLAIFDRWR